MLILIKLKPIMSGTYREFEMKTIFCFFYWTNIEKWPQLISKNITFKPTCGEKIAQNTKRVHVYF